jgi:hypothetical protein
LGFIWFGLPLSRRRGLATADSQRRVTESDRDRVGDLHLWRLGPGHLGAMVSVVTPTERCEADHGVKLGCFRAFSHLTNEVRRAA